MCPVKSTKHRQTNDNKVSEYGPYVIFNLDGEKDIAFEAISWKKLFTARTWSSQASTTH